MLIISLMVNGYRLAPGNLELVIERKAISIPCVSLVASGGRTSLQATVRLPPVPDDQCSFLHGNRRERIPALESNRRSLWSAGAWDRFGSPLLYSGNDGKQACTILSYRKSLESEMT